MAPKTKRANGSNEDKEETGAPDLESSGEESSDEGNRDDSGPPAGFDVNVSRAKGDGWLIKEAGNSLVGRLLGRFSFEDGLGKERAFYQVRSLRATKATVGTGDEAHEATLPAGSIINVDESAALSDLAKRAEDGGTYDVWMRYRSKEKSRKGKQGFWPMDIRLKVIKPPIAVRPPTRRERDNMDDVPF
jgi:hypothetical protein